MSDTAARPGTDRLLAIISLQNEIAAARSDFEEVMRVVVQRAGALTPASAAVVELVDGEEMVYRAVSGTAVSSLGLRLQRGTSLSGRCVELAAPLRCDDVAVDPRVDRDACRKVGIQSMICVPLLHQARALGVLKVASGRTHAFSDVDVETLQLLASIIATSMHQANEFEAMRHDSMHDALTGLPNRRALEEQLSREVERHRRHGTPLSVALLDLDGFKIVNDQLGHHAGDEVLKYVARQLKRSVRTIDGCFRIGGDEFVLVLPDSPLHGAQVALERCAGSIHAARLGGGLIDASFGVVEAGDETAEQLLDRADTAMYAMKRGRR